MDGLGGDLFCNMVSSTCAETAPTSTVRHVCEGIVQLECELPLAHCDFEEDHQPLREAIETILKICKSLLSLMIPMHGYMDITTEDTLFLSTWEETEDEAFASLIRPLYKAMHACDYWRQEVDEVIKHGASAVKKGPVLKELIQNLKVETGAVVTGFLERAINEFHALSQSFRPGGVNELRDLLHDRLLAVVPAFMKEKVESMNVSHIELLEKGMEIGAGLSQKMADLRMDFTKWKDSLAVELAGQRLVSFVTKWVDGSALDGLPDFEMLAELLEQTDMGTESSLGLSIQLREFTRLVFQKFKDKAGSRSGMCDIFLMTFLVLCKQNAMLLPSCFKGQQSAIYFPFVCVCIPRHSLGCIDLRGIDT